MPTTSPPARRPAAHHGYVRVATPAHDPQPQIAALTAFGLHPRRIYLDRGPATCGDRPELARLLGQLHPGDALVIWRMDRLGRSLAHLSRLVTNLGAAGVGVISLTEEIDTTPPAGRAQLKIFAALDAAEHHARSERTLDGLSAARARGARLGRPTIMTPDKTEHVRQLLAQHTPKGVIAKTIGVSRPTLDAHLRRQENSPDAGAPCQIAP